MIRLAFWVKHLPQTEQRKDLAGLATLVSELALALLLIKVPSAPSAFVLPLITYFLLRRPLCVLASVVFSSCVSCFMGFSLAFFIASVDKYCFFKMVLEFDGLAQSNVSVSFSSFGTLGALLASVALSLVEGPILQFLFLEYKLLFTHNSSPW